MCDSGARRGLRFRYDLCEHHQRQHLEPCLLFSRPITFANYHLHKRLVVPETTAAAAATTTVFEPKKTSSKPRGMVFVWPKRRRFHYEAELSVLMRTISNALYWLHVLHLFPNGAGLPLSQPPWSYNVPLPKPETRDYIIEPDWDSAYT